MSPRKLLKLALKNSLPIDAFDAASMRSVGAAPQAPVVTFKECR